MDAAGSGTLERLMRWYADQCDGEWEHFFGVKIDTLDNPGWTVQIETAGTGTPLSDMPKPADPTGPDEEDRDWIVHWVEDGTFHAAGDPSKLDAILRLFLDLVDRSRH